MFVAIPLDEDVARQVADLVDRVRLRPVDHQVPGSTRDPLDVRWVRMDGLHLTLRFLGPTPEDRLGAIERALREVAGRTDPFPISLAGAGGFPSPGRPRALWLGIADGAAELARLAQHLNGALSDAGWPTDDRLFRAHLTLARADGVRTGPAAVRRLIAEAEAFAATWQADRLVLFQSHTGGGPARYEPLAEAALGGERSRL